MRHSILHQRAHDELVLAHAKEQPLSQYYWYMLMPATLLIVHWLQHSYGIIAGYLGYFCYEEDGQFDGHDGLWTLVSQR
jgi:hypothetical protein